MKIRDALIIVSSLATREMLTNGDSCTTKELYAKQLVAYEKVQWFIRMLEEE